MPQYIEQFRIVPPTFKVSAPVIQRDCPSMSAGLNVLVSFVLDAFMGELEAEAESKADKEAAGCASDENGGPGFGSRGHAIQVFDGSVLADSTDVQGATRC